MKVKPMRTISKKDWFLLVVYGVALALLLMTASVTAYVLSHPELGLKERNPIVLDYVSKYGLELGLLLVNLYNIATIFFSWILFTSYLELSRKYRWKITLADSFVYGAMSAYGIYLLISWLLNAAHDISWLLFNSCPHLIAAIWKLWDNAIYLIPAILADLLPLVYYLMRKGKTKTQVTNTPNEIVHACVETLPL